MNYHWEAGAKQYLHTPGKQLNLNLLEFYFLNSKVLTTLESWKF